MKHSRISNREKVIYRKRNIQHDVVHKITSITGVNVAEFGGSNKEEQCILCEDYSADSRNEEENQTDQTSDRSSKIQILTFTPKSLRIKVTSSTFGVSERMVKLARKLRETRGIDTIPEPKLIINPSSPTWGLRPQKHYFSTAPVSFRILLALTLSNLPLSSA